MPAWAGAPGMSQLSCGVPPKVPARPTKAAASTSQAEIVRQGWAAVEWPRRWRRRDMGGSFASELIGLDPEWVDALVPLLWTTAG